MCWGMLMILKNTYIIIKPVIHGLDQIRYFLSTHRVDEIYVNLSAHNNLRETYQIFELLGIPMKN